MQSTVTIKNRRDDKKKTLCNICQKTITGSSYKFKAHLYKHKVVQARYKCAYCLKEFFRTDTFTKHIKKHKGTTTKKTYICDHCDRSFSEKPNLINHLQIHCDQGSYYYKCMACGVQYCEERLLKYHIRKTHFNLNDSEATHTKKELNETWVERVNESEICVQMTKVNNNMISIKRFGTIDKDFKKKHEIRDEKAKFKEYMKSVFAHKDCSQYSKAVCDYCNKEMLKKSLLSHIRERHLKLKRFECKECSRMFSRHYMLVDHVCGKKYRKMSK